MQTKKAAVGHWGRIFEYYGMPPVTGVKHYNGPCPICGARGKFRCDDKDGSGSWICVCGHGDGMELLQLATGKPWVTLCDEIDRLIGNTWKREKVSQPVTEISRKRKLVMDKFSRLSCLRGTTGEAYLQGRGILQLPTESVRFCDRQIASGREYQALYAIATDDKGSLCYLHRTLLDGDRKANVEAAKKMTALQELPGLQYAKSVAIRLYPVSSTLGIAEGIETALSCRQIFRCNVWSTMNSGFMEKFIAPPGVNHLIIFADNDAHGAGLAAAFKCGHKNLMSCNDVEKVSIRWPDLPDFNDMLIQGGEAREHVLTRKFKAEAA
ncbi:toprim domain-containing protein [Escherichia coli]|nr:DNA primase [Escherichia coli]EET5226391.1 DNA primase [Escherichia coli]EET7266999.1 DNA primase [Escherichia coli]EEU0172122.1 DNA primase [Escherichia coli]EEU2395453.1 DNA primase [Escherichia coli]